MYKKIMALSLVANVSVQAVPGQELQVVMQTPVAQAIRWLSSGKPEANVAAGAVAASVVYSGVCLVTLPYRAWSKRCEHRVWAEQLSGIADQVKKNSERIASSSSESKDSRAQLPDVVQQKFVEVSVALKELKTQQQQTPVVTQEQFEKMRRELVVVTAALEKSKTQEQTLAERLAAVEQRPSQSHGVEENSPQDFGGRLTAVEGQVKDHTGQITSATKKINEAFHLGQKVSDLEEKVTTLVGQVAQLQNKVFPANTSK